jgi:hypothetical protein
MCIYMYTYMYIYMYTLYIGLKVVHCRDSRKLSRHKDLYLAVNPW